MKVLFKILRSRDFLLTVSIVLGLFLGDGAKVRGKSRPPGPRACHDPRGHGCSRHIFRSPKDFILPALVGMLMNYGLLGGLLLGLNFALIRDDTLRAGFVIMAAVPPAVAVIPFTVCSTATAPFP